MQNQTPYTLSISFDEQQAQALSQSLEAIERSACRGFVAAFEFASQVLGSGWISEYACRSSDALNATLLLCKDALTNDRAQKLTSEQRMDLTVLHALIERVLFCAEEFRHEFDE